MPQNSGMLSLTPIVGYNTFTTRSGFNYYVPQFRAIGSDVQNINDIQLDSQVGDMGANLQLLAAGGTSAAYYNWLTAASSKDFGYTDGSKGCWVDEDLALVDDVELAIGAGVQIDIDDADMGITNAGQVSDDDVTFTTRSGFNYVGNAFPTGVDVNAVQLSSTVGDMGANLQILAAGGTSAAYYNWLSAASAKDFGYTDGTVGCWVDEDLAKIEGVTLEAGAAFQIDIDDANETVTVLSPIEL